MKNLETELLDLGVPQEAVVIFNERPSARHVKYLDLLSDSSTISNKNLTKILPDGVIESGSKPAIYFADRASLSRHGSFEEGTAHLLRTLACRADAHFLAVIEPGRATIYNVGFYPESSLPVPVSNGEDMLFLRNIVNGIDPQHLYTTTTKHENSNKQWLDDLLFKLLTQTASALREVCPKEIVSDGAILSIIGRALFTRFLADREIITSEDSIKITGQNCEVNSLFGNSQASAATFSWLDKTFNGNLLDLGTKDYVNLFESLGDTSEKICKILSDIMHRAVDFQLSLDWGGLRFKHIPVDVLSQVYEHFAHSYMPDAARKTSVHYTPRHIAELLVDGAFSACSSNKKLSAVTVLDPAVGAGVFLVLSFRRIVGEVWLETGQRPNRKKIRDILNNQFCGLDINSESLKVAALSLYLAAIELDPDPQPLEDLRFDNLFGSVLLHISSEILEGEDAIELGSLSDKAPNIGKFDIVLGNPPWTVLGKPYKKPLEDLARSVFLSKTGNSAPPGSRLVPSQWPDVAFLWKAMEWCKDEGSIALLIHARFLFGKDSFFSRKCLFETIRVTGVLNGTALRQAQRVWPSIDAPFCAIVANNIKPDPNDAFYFLSPYAEKKINDRGEFRLDPRSALTTPTTEVGKNKYIFKTLFRGTSLDHELVERIQRAPREALSGYLERMSFTLGQGFIRGKDSERTRDAIHLADLPVLEANDKPIYSVNFAELSPLKERYPVPFFQWPRSAETYIGPLLLFRQAPKLNVKERGAVYSSKSVAFGRGFYGLVIGDDINRAKIADYIYVLSYSDIFIYWPLMTSSQFGIERDTFNMEDVLQLPVVPYDKLEAELKTEAHRLAKLIKDGAAPWGLVNDYVRKVYRFSCDDQSLINDALAYSLPYAPTQKAASSPIDVNNNALSTFSKELSRILNLKKLDNTAKVTPISITKTHGWKFVRVSASSYSPKINEDEISSLIKQAADPFWASQIRIMLGQNDWLIGQIDNHRYWSLTRARLMAFSIVGDKLFQSSPN